MHLTKESQDNLILWSDEWIIDHREIDAQHRTIITMLNLLSDDEYSKIQKINSLPITINYMLSHMKQEESVMEEINYLDISQHIKLNEEFREKINLMMPEVKESSQIPDELFHYLKIWWVEHITKEDSKLKEYLT